MIVKIKIDDWAKKRLTGRMGIKALAQGRDSLNLNDMLIYSLTLKEDGDIMDLTQEAGKLQKLIDTHE